MDNDDNKNSDEVNLPLIQLPPVNPPDSTDINVTDKCECTNTPCRISHRICSVECAINAIADIQCHFGIVLPTLQTAEDYNIDPKWFRKNIHKIKKKIDEELTCVSGCEIDLHECTAYIIDKMHKDEKAESKSLCKQCCIQ